MNLKKRWWLYLPLALVAVFLVFFVYGLVAVRGTFEPGLPASAAPGQPVYLGAPGHAIDGRSFVSGSPNPAHALVVLLHGDAPNVNPRYEYTVARLIADAAPGTRVVALLRPGYADPYGMRSDGDRMFSSGETYTPQVIEVLASAIAELKAQYHAPSIILAGHSGGAALTADIAALHPGLVQQAFLIGCPCDVPAFRRHMWHLQHSPLWLLPVKSVSPMNTIAHMGPGTSVTAINGADDPIALPVYAKDYVARARSLGIAARLEILPGKGHEIFEDPEVIHSIAQASVTAR